MTASLMPELMNDWGQEPMEGIFQALFQGHGKTRPVADDEAVVEALRQSRGDRLRRRVEHALQGRALTARQEGILKLGQRTLREYFGQPAFHHELAHPLLMASGGLLARAFMPHGWLTSKEAPEHELLLLMGRIAMGWSPASERADRIRDMLCGWLNGLGADRDVEEILRIARHQERGLRDIRDRRGATMAAEHPGLSRLAARRLAARTLNRQLAGRQQPEFMVRDLHEHWFPAMQKVLMEQGADSPLWSRLVRLLSLVLWGLQPGMDEPAQFAKLKRVAAQLHDELPAVLAGIVPDPAERDRMIDHIEVALYSVLHGRQVRRRAVPPLEPEGLPEGLHISGDIMAMMDRLGSEDWFQLADKDLRVSLLARRDDTGELMLADQFGRRVLTCQRDELAWRLTAGDLRPVPAPESPVALIRERLGVLARQLRSGSGNAGGRAQPKPVMPWKRKAPTAKADDTADPCSHHWARMMVSRLAPGQFAVCHGRSGSRTLRLALFSGDRFVFVDRQGRKQLELDSHALMDAVASGRVEPQDTPDRGTWFHNLVERIHRERRKTAASA